MKFMSAKTKLKNNKNPMKARIYPYLMRMRYLKNSIMIPREKLMSYTKAKNKHSDQSNRIFKMW